MILKRIVNNNVVIAEDQNGEECIIIGKGIGFSKKINEQLDMNLAFKVYRAEDTISSLINKELYKEAPEQLFIIVSTILHEATVLLNKNIHKSVYPALLDHLTFAIKRSKKGLTIKNQLLWDIKRLFKNEFNIGLEAIKKINTALNVELDEHEASFIALHLINAQKDDDSYHVEDITKITQGILNIIKYHFNVDFDEESIEFQRLLVHLKFFSYRLFSKESTKKFDTDIFDVVSSKYKDSFNCAISIADYINNKYKKKISSEELSFLTIHIENVRG